MITTGNIILDIALVLIVILLSMTLHEAMHAYTGNWLGDDTAKLGGRLTLNPLAHIDPFMTVLLPIGLLLLGAPPFGAAKPVPFNPNRVKWDEFGAALVGLSGPFTNLVLAFIGFVTLYVLYGGFIANGVVATFLYLFITVNLAFFVFNMLPIPPLDGSRALYAIAPDGIRRFMEMMEQNGIFIVFAIILLFNAQLGMFMRAAIGGILDFFTIIVGG